jgi:hypothetical protein
MKATDCALFLASLPAVLLASPVRVARVGELEGKVEVQLHPADAWRIATRNLPLVEGAWVRTGPGSRVEIELDEGSALRLFGEALCEFSDYTHFSTGQRVTLLSLDHGVAYFTGAPDRRDALILAVPDAQISLRVGTRVRMEVNDSASRVAVLEGKVRFSSPAAELDLNEGHSARVENGGRTRFFLDRDIAPLDTDRWNEERDKALAASTSSVHLPGLLYGLVDLDISGVWMQTDELGLVWKPKVTSAWRPYRDGQWLWYDELGYTWIANESWGWLPFHYGRWLEQNGLGWVWLPGKSVTYKPGEVFWLREANLVGWGPLAPGETWGAASVPRLYLRANTTFARWSQDARVLTPADPTEKLAISAAVFVIAPPSPAWDSARLDVVRPVLRAGSTRIAPLLPAVIYAGDQLPAEPAPAPVDTPVASQPFEATSNGDITPIVPPPGSGPGPVPEPPEVYYPAPIYTGIIVVNPPEDHQERHAHGPATPGAPPHDRPHPPSPEPPPDHPGPAPIPAPPVQHGPPPRPEPPPRPISPKESDGPKSSDFKAK